MLAESVISLPKGDMVCCRFWEDESVVYNQLSGKTHLIDGLGAHVFKLISAKAITRTALLENIDSVFEFEIDSDVAEVLDNLILEYQKLGLLVVTENNPA